MRRQVIANLAVLYVVVLGLLAWGLVRHDSSLVAIGLAALLAAAAFSWFSLRRGRHMPLAQARERAQDESAIALWKPGCVYCERLQRALRHRDDVAWVNVWADDDAQRLVCSLNGGDEYTPTVLVGEDVLRNPSAADVERALAARA